MKVPPAAQTHGSAVAAKIHVQRWTVEDKELRVTAREPLRLALRLLNYPAWRVEVNGTKVTPQTAEEFGQMIVAVPAGESHIVVRFARTLDRILGNALSVASFIAALLLLWWPQRT